MATSLEDVLVCPISLQLFRDPVVAEDGQTYERAAIAEWIRSNGTSPLTRQPLTINALRPNFALKKVIEQFETKLQEQKFSFKLNIDVRREKRALFQTFGKSIYKAGWMNQQQARPPIIILKIDGARASKEASFYVSLSRHPHIVRTYGLVEDATPNTSSVMLLQEYASEGSLYELLSDQEVVPATEVLEEMFMQIADAMIYLAYNGVVHGDLACRNVLIFRFDPNEPKRNLVKLTDFGLSRFSTIYSSIPGSVSTTTIHVIPIRTVAPEILLNNCADAYSEKSDIFSMGMLMIEALNKGEMPWANIADDNEVRKLVIAGNRPPRPQTRNCTDKIWKIISNCLAQSSTSRPTFKELREQISQTENQRNGYSPANNSTPFKHPDAPTAPTSSFHENDSFTFQNDFYNSMFSAATNSDDWQVNMTNSNPNASFSGVNNINMNSGQTITSYSTEQKPAHNNSFGRTTGNQNNGQQGTQTRHVGSYHTIEAGGMFRIILNADGSESVTLTSEQQQLLDSVEVVVDRGVLRLKMSGANNNSYSFGPSITIVNNNINMTNYSSNDSSGRVTAHISGARHLTSLITSGQCTVESRSTLTGDRFQLTLSGSSSFDGLFNFKQLNVIISGSSNVSFGGSTDIANLTISGSSSCRAMKLTMKTANITVSGCSNATLKGSAEQISLNVSGSSSCDTVDMETNIMQVSVSGASHATVHCTKTLETDVKGSSDVRYKGNAKVLKGPATKIR